MGASVNIRIDNTGLADSMRELLNLVHTLPEEARRLVNRDPLGFAQRLSQSFSAKVAVTGDGAAPGTYRLGVVLSLGGYEEVLAAALACGAGGECDLSHWGSFQSQVEDGDLHSGMAGAPALTEDWTAVDEKFEELFDLIRAVGSPRLERELLSRLPVNTHWVPGPAGVIFATAPDLDELIGLAYLALNPQELQP